MLSTRNALRVTGDELSKQLLKASDLERLEGVAALFLLGETLHDIQTFFKASDKMTANGGIYFLDVALLP